MEFEDSETNKKYNDEPLPKNNSVKGVIFGATSDHDYCVKEDCLKTDSSNDKPVIPNLQISLNLGKLYEKLIFVSIITRININTYKG